MYENFPGLAQTVVAVPGVGTPAAGSCCTLLDCRCSIALADTRAQGLREQRSRQSGTVVLSG